jgi:hypothetical protein
LTVLSFVLPVLLFILYPSRMWNFDGVACAAALELGNPVYFFHSNHLLYGFLGFLFWKPFYPWAFDRALPALQLFTSLLSAIALSLLYRTLRRILADPATALLLTLCASAAAVVWVWSVEAQVYALGFLALCGATWVILSPEHRSKWTLVGLLHAGAILGHIVHVLWTVPALYWLLKDHPTDWRKPLRQYAVPLTLCTVLPYTAVIAGVIVPQGWSDRWLVKWLMGSAALNPTSVFQWHSAGWVGPLQWLSTTPRIFWGSFWPYYTTVPGWAWGLTILSVIGVAGGLLLSLRQRHGRIWMFCALWLGVYAVFFWTWEPHTECYRMTDMIPIALLLALGLQGLPAHAEQRAASGLLLLTLLLINSRTRLAPMHEAQNNPLYQQTLALASVTPENSLYLTGGSSPWLYVLYFTGRSAWDLHAFNRDPQRMNSEIRRHQANQPVFIQSSAVELLGGQPGLSGYKLRPVGPVPTWLQLQ